MIGFIEGFRARTTSGPCRTEKPIIIPKGQKPVCDKKDDLVCEIQDLQFEIEEYQRKINKLKAYLNQKEQQLKQMNDAYRNTNEAVETKRKEELLNSLEYKNWKVNVMDAGYPQLELIDNNTVKIDGVEYKKVERPSSPTLYEVLNSFGIIGKEGICNIVRGWLIDHTIIETEDAEKVTFTIFKEQLQTPK